MNKSLTRSIGFWLLLVVSLATTGVGAWLISGQIGTMTTTLLDGTATGIEVYVGQSLVVVGAGVLAAGIIGILLTLGLVAARSLVPSPAPAVVETIDWTAQPDGTPEVLETSPAAEEQPVDVTADAEPVDVADDAETDADAEQDVDEKDVDEKDVNEKAPAVTR
ncbi:hypothetical protein [Microbacterium sp. PMB16]|uniref:hypothetical protein n=1 Tax=Microbacterium sp. PMB16 TaxID=3120157 RepID=UPI003F4BFBE9